MANKSKLNILLLGGFGFIGTNIIKEVLNSYANYNIIVFSKNKSTFIVENKDKIKVYLGDFSNCKLLEKIFYENKIDVVIHLISTTVPANSNNCIIPEIETNLINTINILDLMKKYSVNKIVFFSSGGTVYGTKKHCYSIAENSELNPICSYGVIKVAIEKYVQLYHYLYGIDYLILRVSNPYGEYHQSNIQGLINIVLKKIMNNEAIVVWGKGDAIRDYIYVGDVVKVLFYLLDKKIKNKTVNVGTGRGYSINEIIDIIRRVTNRQIIPEYKESRKNDINRVILNNSKLLKLKEFHFISIEKGIEKTAKWLTDLI